MIKNKFYKENTIFTTFHTIHFYCVCVYIASFDDKIAALANHSPNLSYFKIGGLPVVALPFGGKPGFN